ncbi:hypothetical protein GQ55_4G200000 [Panicum hallii var. hallii]|uniref:Uncharacterized protein n=1 Tax=Panicum hallii var. hallii TaxID=1504633 RepID=A0A2T7DZ48_9POAL|nr:hypothetical protein GQ55_4G200000 [Panicum hallii var. hallii]
MFGPCLMNVSRRGAFGPVPGAAIFRAVRAAAGRVRGSARQRGGLRQWLRRLLGVCLPVNVPVAPSSSCISFTLPQLLNRFLIRL